MARAFCTLLACVLGWICSFGTSFSQESTVGAFLPRLENSDWQVRRAAALELGELASADRDVVAALIVALDDVDSRVRRASATALGRIGPRASGATRALTGRLDDRDPEVALAAARALGLIGRRASRAARDLEPLLRTADAEVRLTAADSLARMGRNTDAAIVALGRLLDQADGPFRVAAAESLGRIGARAASTGRELTALLRDDDPEVRSAAAAALGDIGESVVPVLIDSLNDGNPVFLQAVVEALGEVGDTAVPALVDALHSPDEPLLVRQYAAVAMARIGNRSGRVVPPLIESLADEDAQIRIAAAEALGNLGPAAEAATPRLIELLEDGGEALLVREYAIAAVSRTAPGAPAVAAALSAAVADSNPLIYEAAVAALVEIGLTGTDVRSSEVASLIADLGATDTARRLAAARRLGELGPYARAAVDALAEVLADTTNGPGLRIAAAAALGEIGPPAERAVPTLIAALGSSDAGMANAALVAMRRIGPQTRTIPALMEALRESDLGVRGSAAVAVRNFALARLRGWQALLEQSDAPILRAWLARHQALYGVSEQAVQQPGRDDQRDIPIDDLDAVEVRAHPFEELLEDSGLAPGVLDLADFAPPDRLFVYFKDLAAARELLEGSAELFLRLDSVFSVKSFDYDLASRYLQRLGLSPEALSELESLAAIREMALIVPDLFFVDGTDITVIVRAVSADLAQSALELVGAAGDDGTAITTRQPGTEEATYSARRGELLFMSTNGAELRAVIERYDNGGRASLGQSAEFQYMLQQLPLTAQTRSYFYFSDPFIRRIVGPRVKIAQLRRMRARAELDTLTAGAMLFRLDGHTAAPDKDRLIQLGYVPEEFSARDYEIGEDFVARSARFGTSATLSPLLDIPVDLVSEAEASAYQSYLRNYTQYWRQFFDPIAMRLERSGDDTMELTTFILPLLDSPLYSELKDALTSADSGLSLRVPELEPRPFVRFSLNLSDSMRLQLAQTLSELLEEFTTLDPEIFDAFTATIHIAVQDSSPLVAVGSGDILGALSEDLLRMEGFEPFLPILLSLVSQPASVLIELADADAVLRSLREAVLRGGEGEVGELHQLQGQDVWIYTLNVLDLVQIHLSVAVEDDYLVISNLPWSPKGTQTGSEVESLNGALLDLDFEVISQLLPALHTKAYRDYRRAAVDGMGYLYPLLATRLAETLDEARQRHLELFGYTPVHPGRGQWRWSNGEVSSSLFGTAENPVQPAYVPGDRDFGLFPMLRRLRVGMQLEDAGLRASIRWRLAED
jgi:HEAT repeat protein